MGEILVGVILLSKNNGIREVSSCTVTKKRASINVAYFFPERVIDLLGNPVDGFGTLRADCRTVLVDQLTKVSLDDASREIVLRSLITQLIEAPAPIYESLITGVLVPIGGEERELIIGDRRVGKTSLVFGAIISVTGDVSDKRDVVSIYIRAGKKAFSVVAIRVVLQREEVIDSIIIRLVNAYVPARLQYLAP